jgi:hypothetical protein
VWDAPGLVGSCEAFAAQHRTQHLEPFNRLCAVVGNSLAPVAAVTALTAHRRAGATVFALANSTLFARHAVEGNIPCAVRDLFRHPLWSVRADVAVAGAMLRNSLT